MKKLVFLFVVLVALAGCSSGRTKTDTYTSSTGAVTVIESDREACINSCNSEYSRCGDSDAARRGAGGDIPSDMFGAKAECKDALKDCLPRCKGR